MKKIRLILIIFGALIALSAPAYTVVSFVINLEKASTGIIGGVGAPTLKLLLSMVLRSIFTSPCLFGVVLVAVGCVVSKKH